MTDGNGLRRGGQRVALLTLLVAALSLLPFLGTLNHGFVWDDHALITQNLPLLGNPTASLLSPFALGSEKSTYYRPMVIMSFAADHALWGLDARGYHLTNLLLYAFTVSGLLLLLLGLVPWCAALPAALLFAFHPVHVEAVAFVSGRSDLLAGFFLIGTLLLLRAAVPRAGARQTVLLSSAALCFLFSLLSKESSGFLPLFVLATLWLLRNDGSARAAAPRLVVTVFAGFLGYLLLRGVALRGTGIVSSATLKVFPIHDYPWFLLQWLRLLFFPWNSLPYYEAPAPGIGTAAALLLALGALTLFCRWLNRQRGRDIVVQGALAWLLLSLLPALPLLRQSGAIIADRFLYIPSLGLAALLAATAEPLLAGRRGRHVCAFLVLATMATGVLTGVRAREWRSDLSLFEAAARRNPTSSRLNMLLGREYLKLERYSDAERSLTVSLEHKPRFVQALVALGDLHRHRGETREAERRYQQVLSIKPGHPDAAFGLGTLEMHRGDSSAARAHFQQALLGDPDMAAAHTNLGVIAFNEGDLAEAERSWRRALAADPRNALAMNNLGVLVRARGDLQAARELFRGAIDIDPAYEDARRNLESLDRSGRPQEPRGH